MRYLLFLYSVFRAACSVVLALWEKVRGTKTVHEIKGPENALGSLKGYTVRGYELTIFIQRKEYVVKYDRWYIPNTKHHTYRVMSLVTNDAPEALKKACELDVDLPGFIHPFNFKDEIRRSVVRAYIDMLILRLAKIE